MRQIRTLYPHDFKRLVEKADRFMTNQLPMCVPNKPGIRGRYGGAEFVFVRIDEWSIAVGSDSLENLRDKWSTKWNFSFKIYTAIPCKLIQDSEDEYWVMRTERSPVGTLLYPQVGRGGDKKTAYENLKVKI